MRSVFFGIVSLLVGVNSQVLVDNGVCYHIDNGVRVIEDCPPGTLPSVPQPQQPSTTDDNPTGHEANSTSTSSTSTSSTSTPSSSATSPSNVSSDAFGMFSSMALGYVVIASVFLF